MAIFRLNSFIDLFPFALPGALPRVCSSVSVLAFPFPRYIYIYITISIFASIPITHNINYTVLLILRFPSLATVWFAVSRAQIDGPRLSATTCGASRLRVARGQYCESCIYAATLVQALEIAKAAANCF